MTKYLCLILFSLIQLFGNSVNAQQNSTDLLIQKLQKYSFHFSKFNHARIPLLMANGEMGGLADPFGRGLYETGFSDYWTDSETRSNLPGLMLESSEMTFREPVEYSQNQDISSGILETNAKFENGFSYASESFFDEADKHLFVLKMKNTGSKSANWYLRLPYQNFAVQSKSAHEYNAFSETLGLTKVAWNIQCSKDIEQLHYGHLRCTLVPGESITFKYKVTTSFDGDDYIAKSELISVLNYDELKKEQIAEWNRTWNKTASIILPENKYAAPFYQALYRMYCVASIKRFAASEVQFANLTTPLAAAYGFSCDSVKLDVMNWQLHPFTYGTSGWASYALTLLGNFDVSKSNLDVFYNPEALRWNARNMFPIGKAKVYNQYGSHVYSGELVYFDHYNPNVFCYGHELDSQFRDIRYPGSTVHWDWQLHLNAFAVGMFLRHYEYSGDLEYLKEKGYPVLRGVAEFFAEFLKYDNEKKAYILPPSLSLAEDYFVASPIESALSAKWVLSKAVEYSKKLGLDNDLRERWIEMSKKIYIPQNKDHYLEWIGDDFTREGGGYEGIRGFCYFGFPTTEFVNELDKAKMRRTLDASWIRNKKGEGIVAYTVGWFALCETYLKNPELAREMLDYMLSQQEPTKTAFMEVVPQKLYYHESGITYDMVITTMMLQSVQNTITVFPSVPKGWDNLSFYDLPAECGVRVSAEMKNGKLVWATFKKDGKELLKMTENKPVKIINNNGVILLKTIN